MTQYNCTRITSLLCQLETEILYQRWILRQQIAGFCAYELTCFGLAGFVSLFVCFFCFVFCFCLFYFALQNRRVGTFWATGASFLSGQRWRHFEICAALGTRMFKPQNRGVFCHVTHYEMAFSEVVSSVWRPCFFCLFFFFFFFFAI